MALIGSRPVEGHGFFQIRLCCPAFLEALSQSVGGVRVGRDPIGLHGFSQVFLHGVEPFAIDISQVRRRIEQVAPFDGFAIPEDGPFGIPFDADSMLVDGADIGRALGDEEGALCDIAPTLLDVMGLAVPDEMTGRSLFA